MAGRIDYSRPIDDTNILQRLDESLIKLADSDSKLGQTLTKLDSQITELSNVVTKLTDVVTYTSGSDSKLGEIRTRGIYVGVSDVEKYLDSNQYSVTGTTQQSVVSYKLSLIGNVRIVLEIKSSSSSAMASVYFLLNGISKGSINTSVTSWSLKTIDITGIEKDDELTIELKSDEASGIAYIRNVKFCFDEGLINGIRKL